MFNPYEPLETRTRQAIGVCAVLAVVLVWSGLSMAVGDVKLPPPWDVASAFVRLCQPNEFQDGQIPLVVATLASTSRVLVAGVLVVVIGVPIGVVMGASPRLNSALSPLVDPFRSAPIVAVMPLLVLWMGIDESMKITFLFLGAVVFLIPMVRDAMQAVPRQYYISARDIGATPVEAVWHAVLPMAMPRIADAIIVAVSVMWTYITVAEFVNAEKGLGQLIQQAKRLAAMDQVMVGIFVIIILALLTYQLMTVAKKALFPWETE